MIPLHHCNAHTITASGYLGDKTQNLEGKNVVVSEGAAGLIYIRLFLSAEFSFTLNYYVVQFDMI
jgi:hypothetical protein